MNSNWFAYMEKNSIIEKLPKHLLDLIIDQPYNDYTAQDHALWRFVMRQNVDYLSKVAHESYVEGLKQTGISIEEIPHMYGMNRILKDIGWAAVAVDGFIPPNAFMEFQAYNVLVIAADIRPIDQIEYTPAPDIIHEAAGHAPIIANYEYSQYLKDFGFIGSKAFSSAEDYQMYEAIRHLSIIKTDPYTPKEDVEKAFAKLEYIEQHLGEPSEMSRIRNLHWWTVEYGLIGELKNPKIYGAGLLSSIGESYSCLQDTVKKLPYTLDAQNVGFDITTRQPQLFVTPDFEMLNKVLGDFADTMALRRGGLYGVEQAIRSKNTATCVWSSGLEVSGTFNEVITKNDHPVYLKTNSATTLNVNNKLLEGHGKEYHKHGFSSPIGKFKNIAQAPESMTMGDLKSNGIDIGKKVEILFESGVKVSGSLKNLTYKNNNLVLMSFIDCIVEYEGQVLFQPEWGVYDMAVGSKIVSAFSGPSDPDAFGLKFPVPEEKTHKIIHSEQAKILHSYYQKLREIRKKGKFNEELNEIWHILKNDFPNDWLMPMEIYELLVKFDKNPEAQSEIRSFLESKKELPELSNLISNGLNLIDKGV